MSVSWKRRSLPVPHVLSITEPAAYCTGKLAGGKQARCSSSQHAPWVVVLHVCRETETHVSSRSGTQQYKASCELTTIMPPALLLSCMFAGRQRR
jgi:hypothetical protein